MQNIIFLILKERTLHFFFLKKLLQHAANLVAQILSPLDPQALYV